MSEFGRRPDSDGRKGREARRRVEEEKNTRASSFAEAMEDGLGTSRKFNPTDAPDSIPYAPCAMR